MGLVANRITTWNKAVAHYRLILGDRKALLDRRSQPPGGVVDSISRTGVMCGKFQCKLIYIIPQNCIFLFTVDIAKANRARLKRW